MKKQLASALFISVLSFAGYAQKIVENPFCGLSLINEKLTGVEIRDTATVFTFHVSAPGKGVYVPKETFIQPLGEKDKLMIKSSMGVPLDEAFKIPDLKSLDYQLIFPPINPKVSKIDYGMKGAVAIYDIWLKPFTERQVVKELKGNWYNRENGNWELSILDSTAVYKNKLWQLGPDNFKNGEGPLTLKNGKNKIILFLKKGTEGNCRIGESKASLKDYSQDVSGMKFKSNDEPYKLPVFKRDSAVFKGYINGYNPRMDIKTATIYVNDILTGQQTPCLLKIAEDGTFSVKVPMCYPQTVFVSSNHLNSVVFLEPGKELFQMIDLKSHQQLFMGGLGRLNSELLQMKEISCLKYPELQKKVLELKPNEYKEWLLTLKKKDLDSLESFSKEHPLSAKAYQVKKLDLEYQYLEQLMSYSMNFENSYRKKNKIPGDQRTLPVKPEEQKADYYDFITNENVNNPLAVISNEYNSFINRLKYTEILTNQTATYTISDVMDGLEASGTPLSEEEKTLFEAMKKNNFMQTLASEKEFQKKYSKKSRDFFQKYMDQIRALGKELKGEPITTEKIEKYLTDKGVILTGEEKEYIVAMKELEKDESVVKKREFQKQYNASIQKLYRDRQSFINGLFNSKSRNARLENLEKILHVQKGIATDIMASQDFGRPIVSQMTPVSEKEIKMDQQQISTPFIAEYLDFCNKATKAKVEASKSKTGYAYKEAPITEADKLFAELMKSYKGKVVLVDFWATWCAPCRQGIERIKPLKDEMAGKDVVFVYITGPSSPEQTYNNMIPDIKGEHYRVSNDEWNYLCSKFNVSGIPHQLLVDKKGVVVNPHLNLGLSNESIKEMLEKYLKEL